MVDEEEEEDKNVVLLVVEEAFWTKEVVIILCVFFEDVLFFMRVRVCIYARASDEFEERDRWDLLSKNGKKRVDVCEREM